MDKEEGFIELFGHPKQWGPYYKDDRKPYLKCTMTGLSTLPTENIKKVCYDIYDI
jgi:hypothetical protein